MKLSRQMTSVLRALHEDYVIMRIRALWSKSAKPGTWTQNVSTCKALVRRGLAVEVDYDHDYDKARYTITPAGILAIANHAAIRLARGLSWAQYRMYCHENPDPPPAWAPPIDHESLARDAAREVAAWVELYNEMESRSHEK